METKRFIIGLGEAAAVLTQKSTVVALVVWFGVDQLMEALK